MKSLFAIVLAVMLLAAPCAWSQTSMGQVSGTVRDTSGAVIPDTPVVLVNTATNITSKTTTNQVGFYMFPGVVPGNYSLSVEMAGMQKFEGTLTVEVRQSLVIDPVMQPAGTQTLVEVRDITPLVTTDNPTVGSTLTRSFVEQLPINGRNISSLLQTLPGIEGQRAYGTRQGSSEYVWDGAQEVDRRWGNAPAVGLDAVEEFRVEDQRDIGEVQPPDERRDFHEERHQPDPRFGVRDGAQQRHWRSAAQAGQLHQGSLSEPARVRRQRRRAGVYPEDLQREGPHVLVFGL